MKNLDVLDQEAREREAAEALVYGACTGESEQPTDNQPEESSSDRLFTAAEVQRIVAEKVAQERVNVECREYLLTHYYNMEHVSDELDHVLRILSPSSVTELAAKMEEIETLNDTGGRSTRTATAASRSITASLRQIFGL